jgi:hypothetical protein
LSTLENKISIGVERNLPQLQTFSNFLSSIVSFAMPSFVPNVPPPSPGGRPAVPPGPGPFIFKCVLTAARPAELLELAQIFMGHGKEVIKDGAVAFKLKTSADLKYLEIEEVR